LGGRGRIARRVNKLDVGLGPHFGINIAPRIANEDLENLIAHIFKRWRWLGAPVFHFNNMPAKLSFDGG
jgi:hypothetical protein